MGRNRVWAWLLTSAFSALAALACGGSDSGGEQTGASGASDGSGASAGNGASGAGNGSGASTGSAALDSSVDWEAWDIVYSPMYSAYDGVHVFSLPAYVNNVATKPEDWQAIPADAVTFADWQNDDGSQTGVLITVQSAVPEVTLAASSGSLGGQATLYITDATEEQWAIGEERYKNGALFDPASFMGNPEILDNIMFVDGMLQFSGTAAQLGLETNMRCDGCHTTGADMFQVQHTPTQAARFSDQDLVTIFTMGMKPPGVEFRVLPERFQGFYSFMHTWEVDEAQAQGLVVYLRSLTPEGQGEVLLPTGDFDSDIDFEKLPPECNPDGGSFDFQACQAALPPICRRGEDTYDRDACREMLDL